MAKPLLRWPGGKRGVLEQLVHIVPPTYKRYYELFAGGAAMFFRLGPSRATLNDTNSDLIDCYAAVRDDPEAVIDRLHRLRNSEDEYYRVRGSAPRNRFARAARLMYLTSLAFNGIYRVNFQGEFNVPYGHRPHRLVCEPKVIREASQLLRAATLECGDFARIVKEIETGDVVYVDPPYTVVHSNNGFVRYNEQLFAWQDQLRLAEVVRELHRRGTTVIVSNAYHPSIRQLYHGFKAHVLIRTSRIAASAAHRGQVMEYVFTNSELPVPKSSTQPAPTNGGRTTGESTVVRLVSGESPRET